MCNSDDGHQYRHNFDVNLCLPFLYGCRLYKLPPYYLKIYWMNRFLTFRRSIIVVLSSSVRHLDLYIIT
jgi:hypothetical protein